MSISGVSSIWPELPRYAGGTQETEECRIRAAYTSFTELLGKTEKTAGTSGAEDYQKYLRQKYGNVQIQSIGKDKKSLENIGKRMSGNDVVIAPNILEKMAGDPKTAAYYEGKIDYFFQTVIPRETALCAAQGLVYEPGGVVVHEDGSVTYIGGCSDSPERVAEVNAINKARKEKEAALQKAILERRQEAAREWNLRMEQACEKSSMRAADTL